MQDKVRKIGQMVISAMIAVFLFFYATTTNYKNLKIASQATTAKETFTHTISNVPVTIEYDSEKYFISGFLPTVNVDLIGSNRVILQKETDESTRTFQVIADLKELGEGDHTVELKMTNLPTGVNAVLNPTYFIVTIGKRVSQTFDIVGRIPDSQIAEGYTLTKLAVGNQKVKVTTDEETLQKIHHVEAVITSANKLSENYSGTAILQAVDADGNILPVVFSQEVTTIQAIITKIK